MSPARLLLPCVALACALAAPGARATVYKCLLDDGRTFYQDEPCAPGRELRDFDKDPATVSVVPFDVAPPAARTGSKPSTATSGTATKPRTGAGSGSKAAASGAVPKPDARPARKVAERSDPSQRKFLRPGMSEGEVVARVGPPDMTSSGTRKGARWTYMPVPEDAHTITNLQFDNGRLVEVERKVLR